jgi:uncharacterized membrane protein
MTTMRAPTWLTRQVDAIEQDERLDRPVERLEPIAGKLAAGSTGDVLQGNWLGHAFHPLLTDFPLGCWAASGLLDLIGGKRSRRASQRLVGLGLVFVPITAATGAADWSVVKDPRVKRVGAVHAIGNVAVALLYYRSWRSRRHGHHFSGVLLGMAGGLLAWVTGYLGGHMSFARGAGTGERGLHVDGGAARGMRGLRGFTATVRGEAVDSDTELLDVWSAAALLDVDADQVHAMVAADLLVPASGSGPDAKFDRADVMAARLIGG